MAHTWYFVYSTAFFLWIFFFSLLIYTPTLQGFCAHAHRFTLKCWRSVGGVGVDGTNQPTHHPTHPENHSLTNSRPSTHPATMQGFYADARRFTVEAIPRLLLEHLKNRRTADAASYCNKDLDQLGVCHAPHSDDYFILGQSGTGKVVCTNKYNSYGNGRDRHLILKALNCIRLLRRRVFCFYCVPVISKYSWDRLFVF